MHFQSHAFLSLLRPSIAQTKQLVQEINLLSIAYAYRPRLRSRLTWADDLPQETLVIRWTGFSPVFRYSYRHSTSSAPPVLTNRPSTPLERSPTTTPNGVVHSFGNMFSPGTFSAQGHSLVTYYALFKWWLLLSQHPSCLCNPHILFHLTYILGP